VKRVLIVLIKVWRAVVSPWYGPVCRYYPSCSAYGLEAVELHGAIKGVGLAAWRILRCNPWSRGGVDPVPGSALEAQIAAENAAEAVPQAVTPPTPVQADPVGWRPFHPLTNEVCPC